MDPILNQSRPDRLKESMASCFSSEAHPRAEDTVIAIAPSDHGVLRNGGRAGTRWGPAALLASFKKLSRPQSAPSLYLSVCSDQESEARDFDKAVTAQSQRLKGFTLNHPLVHLGGGHDHILPLLHALDDAPVCVLNVDAHLDTRIDPEAHSGNPFRQFATHGRHALQLFQLGIHPYANSGSTQSALPRGEMHLLMRKECDNEALVQAFLAQLEQSLTPQTRVVFSLDCDALEVAAVEAVSAPNHHGLSLSFVLRLVAHYRDLCQRRGQAPLYGVYEFNPLYDTVSGRSARAISALLYDMVV